MANKTAFPKKKLLQTLRKLAKERSEAIRDIQAGIDLFQAVQGDKVTPELKESLKDLRKRLVSFNWELAALQWALIELQKGQP